MLLVARVAQNIVFYHFPYIWRRMLASKLIWALLIRFLVPSIQINCVDCPWEGHPEEFLLTNAIHFVKKHTKITNQDIDIIMHSRKSILIHNGSPWVKKDNDGMFNITMGSFDGTEVCKLVGLFIFRKWKTLFFHLIDMAVVNSFILLRAHQK